MGDTYFSEWQPSNPIWDKVSKGLRAGREFLDKARVPEGIPVIGGLGLGEALIDKTPEAAERIAYGQPLTKGTGFARQLDPDVASSIVALTGLVSPGGKGGGTAARMAAKEGGEFAGDALEQSLKRAARGPEIIVKDSAQAPLLPRDAGMYTNVPQQDLARQRGRGGKYTDRMQDLLDSRSARAKVDELIGKGEDLGMRQWYGTEPLRQAALNEGLTQSDFDRFLAHLASASQRNPVDQQNKMGTYMWHLDRQGALQPDTRLLTNKLRATGDTAGPMAEFPQGLGSLAQGDIFDRSKQIALGIDPRIVLPEERKLGTFYRNLQGNLRPVTVDVNAVRGPILASKRPDPRWLESKVVEKDELGKKIAEHRPRADVEEGRMSLAQARERPGFWVAAPEGSDYAGFEDLWQRAARRHGIQPAEAQALGWYGSADVTALKTKPELYVDNFERLVRSRAQQQGLSPTQMLSRILRGEDYLRMRGGGSTAEQVARDVPATVRRNLKQGSKQKEEQEQ